MSEKKFDGRTCGGCGFSTGKDDWAVEAGGIYNCPNPFCSITGAWNVRSKLGFQVVDPLHDKGVMTERGLFLMNWMMKNVELYGGKVPEHLERFRDESVLLTVPEEPRP